MTRYIRALAAFIVALTSGCGTVPEYHAPPGAAVAKLNLKSQGSKWVCVSGQRQWLTPDSTGYANIPVGRRLTIGSDYHNDVYGGVSTSCNPRSSIVPQSGQHYYIDFEIEAEHCNAFIFKEDATSRTGLALDSTFEHSSECSGK
jgi:hypothetical protein